MSDWKLRWRWLLLAGAVGLHGAETRAAITVGTEFQVNSFTTGRQYFAGVAAAPNGAFVVVWTSAGQDGDYTGVFGQRYDSLGVKSGGEFQINTFTPKNEMYAQVGVEPDGDFVVVWNRRLAISEADVFGQRYSSAGVKLGSEFQVNTFTPNAQYYPAVAVDGNGAFVVVWTSYSQDGGGSDPGVFGQRFSSSGAKVGLEFEVNTYTPGAQKTVAIGMESNGDFVVSWDSPNDADSSFGVRAQRWSSAGAKLGLEFAVNAYTTDGQYGSALGLDADGDFVVVWTSFGQDAPGGAGVFGQRYDSAGAKVGGEFQVNTVAAGAQYIPRFNSAPRGVAIDTNGDFVVVWTGTTGILGQRFASTGAKLGSEFQISVYPGAIHNRAATAMEANGDFIVAWNSDPHDGSEYGVFARRFAFVRELDIDDNTQVDPLTDGLLVLRRLFGFSGPSLVTGAVGNGCLRCDSASIASYIDSILAILDIDSSGELEPLSDGLLILRRLFGFSGATLIN
ncbi:MAG TPA: hypothetical protein VHR17_08015, partial [Thermoanaerobaculia bacterium]|nr:hypothetical protein [Thermoanaerobaculia bacterium]